jgi:hypothetical protein
VTVPDMPYDGARLAAALLMHTPSRDRRMALGRIAIIGTHARTSQEETA